MLKYCFRGTDVQPSTGPVTAPPWRLTVASVFQASTPIPGIAPVAPAGATNRVEPSVAMA